MPPSTNSSMPVTKLDHRMPEKAQRAISSACPIDPLGLWKQSRPSFLEGRFVSHGSIYRTWTNDIDPDPSFGLGSPSSGEKTEGRFAGLYTLVPGNPLTPALELFKMIDSAVLHKGRAFCTVNKVPRTLTLNVSSKPFSVMEPSGLLSSP